MNTIGLHELWSDKCTLILFSYVLDKFMYEEKCIEQPAEVLMLLDVLKGSFSLHVFVIT